MDKQPSTKNNPEEFVTDLSLEDLFMLPNDKYGREWFEENIWPNGCRCPRCGYKRTHVTRHPEMPYWCSECKRYFSVKIGTIMEHSKISHQKWTVTAYLLAARPKGISAVQLDLDLMLKQNPA